MTIGSRTLITVNEKVYGIIHEKTTLYDNEVYSIHSKDQDGTVRERGGFTIKRVKGYLDSETIQPDFASIEEWRDAQDEFQRHIALAFIEHERKEAAARPQPGPRRRIVRRGT